MFKGKSVLITGGTGSIGEHLVKKISESSAKRIVVFSRDEDKQFKMRNILNVHNVEYVIGDIRDRNRLNEATKGIDFVLHTAAMKQVPIAEENPYEASMTNIIGTYNVIQAAIQNNVERLVVFSSDKAVSPTNCMGMSKGICEKIARATNSNNKTIITIIRLGNVIGTRGSVLTVWKDQINSNQKITLTTNKMTRFIMSLTDVSRLVDHALQYGKNGEIIFSAMSSCRIVDLAKIVCRENSLDWEKSVIITGMRRGEKEFEEIYGREEVGTIYRAEDYFHISSVDLATATPEMISQKSNGSSLLTIEELHNWLIKNQLLNL